MVLTLNILIEIRIDLPVRIATLCFKTDPFPQPSAFCAIFFSIPQNLPAPPQLIPSLRGEILAVSPLGFLLSFSRWALELFLAWGTFTVNPPGIHLVAGAGSTSLPTALSCLWPTSALTAVGLLSPVQGLLILCRRCYWRPQGTYSHLPNTIIKLPSVLVCFSIRKAKWFLSGHACHSAELKQDCLGRLGCWLPALLALNYCSKSTVFYK